jgi:hypothetical protein
MYETTIFHEEGVDVGRIGKQEVNTDCWKP